jgi:hypothetical protein
MKELTKAELIKLLEPCNDDAKIIVQFEGCSADVESGECLDVENIEVYTDNIFVLVKKEE